MLLNHRLLSLGLWAASSSGFLVACGVGPAESPNPTQPIEELRARSLISVALQEEKEQPEQGREIQVGPGKRLSVDVGVAGKKHGIAYVTQGERQELGGSIPPPDVGSNALRVVRDISEPDTVVLLLHDTAYVADDQMGSQREVTSIMAERKLGRDVKDFLVQARAKQWP